MSPMLDKYRHTFFRDPICLEVLGDILQHCHFGETLNLDNPHEIAEHNVGIVILNKCGVFGNGTLPQVLNAFTAVTPEGGEKDEKV